MRRRPVLTVIASLYVAWGAWHWYANRPLRTSDGVLAAEEPQQTVLSHIEPVQMGRWTLTPRAGYRITARVLAREQYHFDALADLVPEDLALGWGPMSDNRNLRFIDISQSNRFYYWHTDTQPPIPREAIITHSANTHVIPRDKAVAILLSRLRPGEVIALTGALVDARRSDGLQLNTSMTRNDSGPGACEVMLVDDVSTP